MSTPQHWDTAYAQGETTRGWYQPEARLSMRLLRECGVDAAASVIDIGGGASVLADDLLDAGYSDITVLDQSPVGLQIAQARLGERAARITWITADLLAWSPPREYDVWHDRAVLHFLLEPADQARYAQTLLQATKPGSLAVIGVFATTGPQMCAGLEVHRFDRADITDLLGDGFQVLEHVDDVHVKPSGETQDYLWTAARRLA